MTMILGPDGRPARTEEPTQEANVPQLRGGSLPFANPGPGDAGGGFTDPATRGGWTQVGGVAGRRYFADRATARRVCRTLYLLPNALFWGAVQLVAAFLMGDTLTYGDLDDKTAQLALDEFWQANNLSEAMTQRWIIEFLLDGENATVFPTGSDNPGADLPARVAFLDVDGNVSVTGSTARGITAGDMAGSVTLTRGLNDVVTWESGEFVWSAHDALWNDVRGWPVVAAAADAAMAYTSLANLRMNVHDIQQRIVAVYSAIVDPDGRDANGALDGGMYGWRLKTSGFKRIPRDGGILPIVVKPGYTDKNGNRFDSVRETLEFPQPASGAGDAAEDAQTFLRLAGLAMGGLPEHWLGNGGEATRTTASEMSTPATRVAGRRQALVRSYLDRLIRTELKRRFGPDRLYTVYKTVVGKDGLKRDRKRLRLPADMLEFPWQLPAITEENLDTLIRRALAARAAGWASPQTLSGSLGFDPSVENELMTSAGLRFGNATRPSSAPSTAPPDPTTEPAPTEDPAPAP